MRVAVRLDDIAPVMNRENLDRMLDILSSHRAMPLLGVIPDIKDEKILNMDGVSRLDDDAFTSILNGLVADGAVIAMHGLTHVYSTKDGGIFPLNRQSEFAGLDREEQESLLREGRERMEKMGFETDIFMAPSHSYDENTIIALKNTGFKKVTDGFGYAPYRYRELTWYPISFSKKQLLRDKNKPGTVTLVYHVNTMKDSDFTAAAALFDALDMMPYKELLYEPTVRRSDPGRMVERIMALGKRTIRERLASGRRDG
ncbi:MAG: DUF2334 domain-containing protein [Lachnospiraceae bacterium]|nr:DUF2334 domain-containing protein [Lachnospiraceae bacterium]